MTKKKIVVFFGGQSAEHQVSIQSAQSILGALDSSKYDVLSIYITQKGEWKQIASAKQALKKTFALNARNIGIGWLQEQKIDVAFPVLHGPYGEDGTIQGLLDFLKIPYIGAGVLASAIGIDKEVQKEIFAFCGMPVLKWIAFSEQDWQLCKQDIVREVKSKFLEPVFVKPCSLGSSIGISRVAQWPSLSGAIEEALQYDKRIIIEQGIEAREIECSVLGNSNPKASVPGEIVASRSFYDYKAKYIDNKSQLLIPARLSNREKEKIQQLSLQAFRAIKARGMARVDFLMDKRSSQIYLNEVNTIPGFTNISMYPKLWEASGLAYPALLDKLIQLAEK